MTAHKSETLFPSLQLHKHVDNPRLVFDLLWKYPSLSPFLMQRSMLNVR